MIIVDFAAVFSSCRRNCPRRFSPLCVASLDFEAAGHTGQGDERSPPTGTRLRRRQACRGSARDADGRATPVLRNGLAGGDGGKGAGTPGGTSASRALGRTRATEGTCATLELRSQSAHRAQAGRGSAPRIDLRRGALRERSVPCVQCRSQEKRRLEAPRSKRQMNSRKCRIGPKTGTGFR